VKKSSSEKRIDMQINLLTILLILLVLGLGIHKLDINSITGMATTANSMTYVSLTGYFAINASTNLTTDGIYFYVNQLPDNNRSASANYEYPNSTLNGTHLFLSVETDSNVNVKFCLKANDSLRYSTNAINLTNYFWNYNSINNGTLPSISGAVNITDNYAPADTLVPGASEYYRFWLTVPGAQPPGTYTNQLNFKGVQTGDNC